MQQGPSYFSLALAMSRDISRLIMVLNLAALLLFCGCASVSTNPAEWQWPSIAGNTEPPGTPAWWKQHKNQAEFVPGEGFRVAGFEGYFDQEGRPINARVAKVVRQEQGKGIFQDVKLTQAVTSIKSQVGLGPDQQLAQKAYAAGEDHFRREEYGKAAKQFKQAISRWPDSGIEQDAMFYLAESQFFANEYPEAVDSYGELLEKYPNSSHLDKVVRRQFDIARYWEEHHQYQPHWPTTPNLFDDTRPLFDTLGRSLKAYENIRLNDPTGPLADDSIMATATSYFLRGRYNDADYYYELIRREYPRSDHQYKAHILGLRCKLLKYQGPDYVATPLLEAKKLIKQLKTQFGGELDEEQRKELAQTEALLTKQLAARDFKRAKGYDDNKYYDSAKFYYAQLVREYPSTPLADLARQRIEELGGKPPHPETKLEWLVDLFPQNAERKAIAQVPLIDSEQQIEVAREPSNETDGTVLR